MEFRGQDHKRIVMPSSFVYTPAPIREQTSKVASIFSTAGVGVGGGERRRDVTAVNGTSILGSSQALDHHHHHHQQQQQTPRQQSPPPPPPSQLQQHQNQQAAALAAAPAAQQQLSQARVPDPDPEPDPDPVPVSIAVAGVTSAPIVGGSNPRTPTARNEISSVRYRECLKNHAASIGGHVVDGCGEFMPGGEEGTVESLKCAACECHRNFHRKESDGEAQSGANYYYCYNPNSKANGSRSRILPPPLPAPPIPQPIQQHQKFPIGLPTSPPSAAMMQPMMMAFGGGGGGSAATDSSSEEMNMFHTNAGPGTTPQPSQYGSLSKKRFRTKFSKEQKDKMMEFAEKVGWRMQKQDEAAVQQFCAEVGVKRQVLKVWMHNNKHSMKKKEEL
ncbi:Zinc-finger homeodomain protein [Thalictrum thalictroides]|uniref:Zinc-finger homeodomain protein n=1 Tax=Thalictrum thalictroides TaxID=46969 RepID=A0A7J6VD89_THATH|nr:Zinc-finger homeodomain protein [Thalictrum thalictroides]